MRNYYTPSPQLPLDFSNFYSILDNSPTNTLAKIKKSINFELYRPLLLSILEREFPSKRLCNSGRRPMDPLFMLKVLFLQRLMGLSDQQMEETIRADRRAQLFLDVYHPEDVPDAKTMWKYRDMFSRAKIFAHLFDFDLEQFKAAKPDLGEIAVAVDSSYMEAPKQRNCREDNKLIKQGKGHQLWNDLPNKKRHKDIDARWAKKGNETHYGYKLHATVCLLSKIITDIHVTAASVHDAKGAKPLINNLTTREDVHGNAAHRYSISGPQFLADAGYVGEDIENLVYEKGWIPRICEKAQRGKPLTEEQKKRNSDIASWRCRIEHVFGLIEGAMKGLITRAIGLPRAEEIGALTAWVYNRYRAYQLLRS